MRNVYKRNAGRCTLTVFFLLIRFKIGFHFFVCFPFVISGIPDSIYFSLCFCVIFSLISFHSPLRLHRIKTHRNSFISYTCLLLLDVIYWMNLSSRALSFITFLMMSCFFMDSLQFHHKFPEHYLHLCHSIIIFPHFSLIIVFFFLEPILSLSLSFCICVVFLLDLL